MAQPKKPSPTKPVDDIVGKVPRIDSYINNLSAAGLNLKDATALVKEQANSTYDMEYAEEQQILASTIEEFEEQYQRSNDAINAKHKDLMNTNRTKKAVDVVGNKKHGDTEQKDNPKMGMLDISIVVAAFALGLVLVLMGATAIYATIMASGSPVFIEQPKLAIMLSALLPIGSIALDLFAYWLPHDRAKRVYTVAIYSLMAVLLMAWIVLFATNFDTASAGVDWDAMAEGESKSGKGGTAFIIVQLLAELFTASSLFLFATDRVAMFRKWTRFTNPEYYEKKDALKELRDERDGWTAKLNQAKGRKTAIVAGRTVYTNNQIAQLAQRAARFKSDGALN